MTMLVIVSQSVARSLELVQELNKLGEVNHQGDGFYTVEAIDNQVYDLTDEYLEVVVKVERITPCRSLVVRELAPMDYWRNFENLIASKTVKS